MKGIRTAIIFAACLCALTAVLPGSAAVSEEQWKTLVQAVGNQDWKTSLTLARNYLGEMDESDQRLPRLRYIYLYAAEGETSEGRMSFEELEKASQDLVGKPIVLPYREIALKVNGGMNYITGMSEANQLMVTATNKDGTTIHAFEYITLKEPFDVAKHNGQQASISGVVEKIIPNPNKSRAIVLRLYITDAKVILKPETKSK